MLIIDGILLTLIMWPLASERSLSYATPQCVGILLTSLFFYPGYMTLCCLEVVPVIYVRVGILFTYPLSAEVPNTEQSRWPIVWLTSLKWFFISFTLIQSYKRWQSFTVCCIYVLKLEKVCMIEFLCTGEIKHPNYFSFIIGGSTMQC